MFDFVAWGRQRPEADTLAALIVLLIAKPTGGFLWRSPIHLRKISLGVEKTQDARQEGPRSRHCLAQPDRTKSVPNRGNPLGELFVPTGGDVFDLHRAPAPGAGVPIGRNAAAWRIAPPL